MRLKTILLCAVWFVFIWPFLCLSTPLISDRTSVSAGFAGNLENSSVKTVVQTEEEPEEVIDDPTEEEEEGEEEGEDDDYDDDGVDEEPKTEISIDFQDSDDLDVLAKGIMGSKEKNDSAVPCFGTWWPSNGGYVYYYDDYGSSYNDGGSDGGSDYGGGNRNRRRRARSRKRKRLRRNRAKRARTTKKAAAKKKA